MEIRCRASISHLNIDAAPIGGAAGMKRLRHITDQMGDVVKRQSPHYNRRVLVGGDRHELTERFHHAVSVRTVAFLIVPVGGLGNADVVQGIEVPYAAPFVVRPDCRVRDGRAARKDFFYFAARRRGEILPGDPADDAMAFVEPGESRGCGEDGDGEKRRETCRSQDNSERPHAELLR